MPSKIALKVNGTVSSTVAVIIRQRNSLKKSPKYLRSLEIRMIPETMKTMARTVKIV